MKEIPIECLKKYSFFLVYENFQDHRSIRIYRLEDHHIIFFNGEDRFKMDFSNRITVGSYIFPHSFSTHYKFIGTEIFLLNKPETLRQMIHFL